MKYHPFGKLRAKSPQFPLCKGGLGAISLLLVLAFAVACGTAAKPAAPAAPAAQPAAPAAPAAKPVAPAAPAAQPAAPAAPAAKPVAPAAPAAQPAAPAAPAARPVAPAAPAARMTAADLSQHHQRVLQTLIQFSLASGDDLVIARTVAPILAGVYMEAFVLALDRGATPAVSDVVATRAVMQIIAQGQASSGGSQGGCTYSRGGSFCSDGDGFMSASFSSP
jgi:predicted lipid-binding transport protein (Tim44 family)